MPVRNAHILDISAIKTGAFLCLLGLSNVALAEVLNGDPLSALFPVTSTSGTLLPRTPASANMPTVVAVDQTVYVPKGSLFGHDGVFNKGAIWGTGALSGPVENHGLVITNETTPSSLIPLQFNKPMQEINRIATPTSLNWLQYGRVTADQILTVNGDYHQYQDGSLYFTVTPTSNSQLRFEGDTLQLEGALQLNLKDFNSGLKGPLRPTYTLIDATSPSAQLAAGVPQVVIANDNGHWGYKITETDTGQVFLTLDPLKYFQTHASTLNQRLMARLIDKEVPYASGALYNALNTLYQLPDAALQNTLTRLDGELHAETPGILYSAVADAWNPVYARMGMSASQGGYVASGDPHLWMSGLGSFGGVEGNLNATGYNQHSAGTLIGGDTEILNLLNVGMTAGYLALGANRTGINNTLSSDLWQIGTYADLPVGNTGHFGLLVGYDQGSTHTQNASILGVANGTGNARLITAEAIGSWRHDFGGGHSLTPIIALQSLTTQHSGLAESGLSALGSGIGSFSSNFVSARVQARYDYQWQALNTDWVSSLAVGFREMLNQPLADREIVFLGTSGAHILTRGAQPNGQTGAGLINAGLTGHLSQQFDLELGYRGVYTGTSRLSSFQGNLVWNYDAPKAPTAPEEHSARPTVENPKAVEDTKSPLTIRDPGADMANYPNSAFTLPEGGFYLETTPFSYTARTAVTGPPTYSGQSLFRYGLVDNIELRLFYTPYEIENLRKGTVSGSGPLAFDTKIHLWDAWESYNIPAAGFELTITTPWMTSTAFQSRTSPAFSFNFDQQIPFDIGIEYNIGASQFEDPTDVSKNVWEFAAQWAAQRDITEDVALFFNGYYNRTTLPRVAHHVVETREDTRYRIVCRESGGQIGQQTCQRIEDIVQVAYKVLVPLDSISSVPVVLGGGLIWTLNDHVQLFGNTAAGVTHGGPSLQTYVGFAWTP